MPPIKKPEGHPLHTLDVHAFVGYTASSGPWARSLYILACVCTGGLACACCHYLPQARLWMMSQCSLSEAHYVQAQLINGRRELLRVQEIVQHHSSSFKAQKAVGSKVPETHPQRSVQLLLMLYIYDPVADTFVPLPDMPAELPLQIHNAVHALQAIDAGADWTHFNPAASWSRKHRADLYGFNDIAIGRPNFLQMAFHLMSYPLYTVQYVELAFQLYEKWYSYAAVLFVISIVSCFLGVHALYLKRMALYKNIRQQRLVPVVSGGRVRAVSSRRLVPGDVVVLLRGKASCDMVLLRGSCLTEESMLSGETAQVRKSVFVPVVSAGVQGYHPDTHPDSTIHAGTFVQQVWNEADSEQEVLAMVVRTGLRSTMGNMLRQVISPLNRELRHVDAFLTDLYAFCGFAFVLQICIFTLFVSKASRHAHSTEDTLQRVVNVLIAALPTGAPTVLVFALGAGMSRLRRQRIDVLLPDKIKTAAGIDTLCFDKTGTLTGSTPEYHGMLSVADGAFGPLQKGAVNWSNRLRQAAAVCHSLTPLGRGTVVCDVAEKTIFKVVEAQFLDHNVVTLPSTARSRHHAKMCTVRVLRQFGFDATLLRSGAVTVDNHAPANTATLFLRGAPSVIEQLVSKDTLPPSYREVVDDWSRRSFRLLAVAAGVVHDVNGLDLGSMSLQQLEGCCNLHLLGLTVLSNHLRPESKATISELQERGALRTMLITGDYHHTAIAVARGAGMIPSGGKLVIVEAASAASAESAQPRKMHSAFKSATTQVGASATTHHVSFRLLHRRLSTLTSLRRFSLSDQQLPMQQPPRWFPQQLPQQQSQTLMQQEVPPQLQQQSEMQQQSQMYGQQSKPQSMQLLTWKRHQLQAKCKSQQELSSRCSQGHAQRSNFQVQGMRQTFRTLDHSETSEDSVHFVNQVQGADSVAPPHDDDQCKVPIPGQLPQKLPLRNHVDLSSGLLFTSEGYSPGEGPQTALDALQSIAQGQAQCCLTGPAFDYMLQHAEPAVVESVMRSAVVFARMRSHQKGQVMELLSTRGLHQVVSGQQYHIPGLGRTCMYCGDGINEMAALAAADVGMAIGSSDASAAASISDKHASVAGVLTVIREARASQAVKVAAIKYMVVYQLLVSLAVNSAFFMDGSWLSIPQLRVLDVMALSLGTVASLRPAAQQLQAKRPPQQLLCLKNCVLVFETVVVAAVSEAAVLAMLTSQPWFTGGTGQSHENPVVVLCWLTCVGHMISAMASFSADTHPWCSRMSAIELVIQLGIFVLVVLLDLLGSAVFFWGHNPLAFYNLPLATRWRFFLISFSGGWLYTFVLVFSRKCVQRREHCKVGVV